jgi:Family of unknown function (DUF6134)
MNKSIAASLVALLMAARADAAVDSRFDFDVLLDDQRVGSHSFLVERAADGTHKVTSTAAFDVKFLGFVAYRYRHQASERWAKGCLTQISSTTNDNGSRQQVSGPTQAGCVVTYAYWDPERLLPQRELLNPQTGAIERVQFDTMGEESIVVRGAVIRADRYRLRNGKLAIDLWYSKAGEWLQLDSTTSSKRKLRYRLRDR